MELSESRVRVRIDEDSRGWIVLVGVVTGETLRGGFGTGDAGEAGAREYAAGAGWLVIA